MLFKYPKLTKTDPYYLIMINSCLKYQVHILLNLQNFLQLNFQRLIKFQF